MTHPGTLPSPRHWLLFSGMDAVLLDDNQGLAATLELLAVLNTIGTPVIFNSNKTPRELARIADALYLDAPRIAEFGSIITYPRELRTTSLGMAYEQICTILDELRSRHAYRFQGFHDWNAAEIALRTGLKLELAQAIRHRKGSELLQWGDTAERLEAFRQHLETAGLELKQDERFWWVKARTGKQQAMQHLINEYSNHWGYRPYVIAIGSQTDDQSMLAAADHAVIVRNENGDHLDLPVSAPPSPQVLRTEMPGAEGWRNAVSQLLQAARTGPPLPVQGNNKRSR